MSIAEKRAALELHGLGPQDRAWVLERLPAVERARVLPLLAELDGMNIRFDLEAGGMPADMDPATPSMAPGAVANEPSPHALLRDAAPADVLRVLAGEPAWVIKAVLSLEQWPWLAAVRAALVEKILPRTQPPGWRQDHPVPPALAAALVPLVAGRLREPIGHVPLNGHVNGHHRITNGSGGWRQIWPKVKRWLP